MKALLAALAALFVVSTSEATCSVNLSGSTTQVGQTVYVDVNVTLTEVSWSGAFGLDLTYPGTPLDFVSFTPSPDFVDWTAVAAYDHGTYVRIGGYTYPLPSMPEPAILGTIRFVRVSGCGNRSFATIEEVDDLASCSSGSTTVFVCQSGS